jgi:hypothetical protein
MLGVDRTLCLSVSVGALDQLLGGLVSWVSRRFDKTGISEITYFHPLSEGRMDDLGCLCQRKL